MIDAFQRMGWRRKNLAFAAGFMRRDFIFCEEYIHIRSKSDSKSARNLRDGELNLLAQPQRLRCVSFRSARLLNTFHKWDPRRWKNRNWFSFPCDDDEHHALVSPCIQDISRRDSCAKEASSPSELRSSAIRGKVARRSTSECGFPRVQHTKMVQLRRGA